MRLCSVILNYFGADDTIACARQLCSQHVKRIWGVDNSADPDQAARLSGAFARETSVQVLETGRNTGFAAGVNYCLRRLHLPDYDAVLVLNNDTVIPGGFIETLVRGAHSAGLRIAGPRIQCYPDTARLWSRGAWYNPWFGLITHRPLFDERFFMYGEDVEYCVRAARAGLSAGVVDEAVLFHKTSASSVNNSCFYEQQVSRAHLLLSQCLFKHTTSRALSVCMKVPFLCLRAIVRSLRYGTTNALTALMSALRSLNPLHRE